MAKKKSATKKKTSKKVAKKTAKASKPAQDQPVRKFGRVLGADGGWK